MSHSNDGPLKLAVYIGMGGMTSLIAGFRRYRRARVIQDMASIDIAGAPQGLVEFQGYAWPVGPIVRSLSGSSVAYRKYELQKYVSSGKSGKWVTEFTSIDPETFAIVDVNGGVAQVFPELSEMEVKTTSLKWQNISADAQEVILEAVGTNIAGFPPSGFFSSSFQVVERCISLGSPVYVYGKFETSPTPQKIKLLSGIGGFLDRLKRAKNDPSYRKRMFDRNLDGVVTDKELSDGLAISAQTTTGLGATEPEEITVAGFVMNDHQHQLYIADCHQSELLNRVGHWNFLLMFVGVSAIAVAFAIIVEWSKLF